MGQRTLDVELRLRMDHTRFTAARETQFIAALASVSECAPQDIKILSVRPGCTVITLRMFARSIQRLARAFFRFQNSGSTPETREQILQELSDPERRLFLDFELDGVHFEIDLSIGIKPPRKNRAVVFVPAGLSAAAAFGNWPRYIWDAFNYAYPGLQSRSYDYAETGATSIVHLSSALQGWLETEFPHSKLAIIAHSLGGLLVRHLLVDAAARNDRLDRQIASVVFVSSPHDTAAFARAAAGIPGISADRLVGLERDAGLFEDLNRRWPQWVREQVPRSCELSSFYSPADTVAPSLVACSPHEKVQAILNQNHLDIARPDSPEAPLAKAAYRFLRHTFFETRENPREDEARLRALASFFKEQEAERHPSLEAPRPTKRLPQVPKKIEGS